MYVFDGETLILRPEGFTLDIGKLQTFLESLPGTFRRSDTLPWVLVAPASDLPRFQAAPMETQTRPGQPRFALVTVANGEVQVYPGLTPYTWGRAQRVVRWLLQFGGWNVRGQDDRDFGVVHSATEIFARSYPDPDEQEGTESPPKNGELTTLRRYMGDPDKEYFFDFVSVHDSGSFSYKMMTHEDMVIWEGRLVPELAARWSAMVAAINLDQKSPGAVEDYEDRAALIIERPGVYNDMCIDAAHPPESCAALVRLMLGWGASLGDGQTPSDLEDVHMSYST